MSRDTLYNSFHFLSRTFLSAFFCLSLATNSCNIGAQTKVWGQTSEPPIRVGTLQRSDLEGLPTQQVILLDRLRRELHPRRVNMQYFSQKGLSSAIAAHSLDFIICDSLSFAAFLVYVDNHSFYYTIIPAFLASDRNLSPQLLYLCFRIEARN